MFRDVVSGETREELKKWIKTGRIFRSRGKRGKISIPIPRIDLPRFIFGNPEEGVGRGEGDPGDVVREEPGRQSGNGATEDAGDAMLVDINMEFILAALQQELELPNLKAKPNETFEDIRIKYRSISKVGNEALVHKRRTMLQALKRSSAMGLLENKVMIPGIRTPITPILPINDDKRYRQWKEIKIPSSNAVIFFARDISGSMGPFKCDIVSDLTWWIDLWIRYHYEKRLGGKVERHYVVHDTQAKEVDEDRFYKMRMGGGTKCSSAFKHIVAQLKHRYPPNMWNIYVFYFSDGDNFGDDNRVVCNLLKNELTPQKVNMFGMTQILPWGYDETVKHAIDKKIADGTLDSEFYRTTAIVRPDQQQSGLGRFGWGWVWDESMDEESRNQAIKNAIKDLLGKDQKKPAAAA